MMFRPSLVITEICLSTRAVSSFAIPVRLPGRQGRGARETDCRARSIQSAFKSSSSGKMIFY